MQKILKIPFGDAAVCRVVHSFGNELLEDAKFFSLLKQISHRRLPHLFWEKLESCGGLLSRDRHTRTVAQFWI
jgi:hypothetical protein